MTPRRSGARRLAVLVPVILLGLTACGGGGGPADLADGDYRAFAIAAGGSAPDASLAISGADVTVTAGDSVVSARIGSAAESYLVCPPNGEGKPVTLDQPVTIGADTFTRPALFGDCGETAPVRVTLVDLDSVTAGEGAPPFGRWIEFCDVTDPDC